MEFHQFPMFEIVYLRIHWKDRYSHALSLLALLNLLCEFCDKKFSITDMTQSYCYFSTHSIEKIYLWAHPLPKDMILGKAKKRFDCKLIFQNSFS